MGNEDRNVLQYARRPETPRFNWWAVVSLTVLALGALGGLPAGHYLPRFLALSGRDADFIGFLFFTSCSAIALAVALVGRWRTASPQRRVKGRWITSVAIAFSGTACVLSIIVYAAMNY
jgi:hypothetical protein